MNEIDGQAVEDLIKSNPCLFCQQRNTFRLEWMSDHVQDFQTGETATTRTVIVICTACEARAVKTFD